jgi:hypothetical protein
MEDMKPPSQWFDTVEVPNPNVLRNVLIAQGKQSTFNDLPLYIKITIVVLLAIFILILLGFFIHPRVREYIEIPGTNNFWIGNVFNKIFSS